jgi:hypothetical protein
MGTGAECRLQPALERDECPHRQLAAWDDRGAAQLQTYADRSQGEPLPPKRGQRRRHRNRPAFDPRGPLHRMTGVDLTHNWLRVLATAERS